ncbi:peptidoglycan-binding protein [Streptomyces rimosus]|uniref:peptidoglycan-binding protein n=1 Tax=Streptomyces rimosus TaxID=1927 RepID=UPI0037D89978
MTAHIYPKADATSQWYGGTYPGDTMPHPNVIVLHTTEGNTFPTYGGGSEAPNFTIRGGVVRQHFYANHSARALVNRGGGVQTNTLNCVQIELVGTCDKGGPGLYWPDASDADLAALVDLVKWLTSTYPIPLVSTPKPWLSYPSSYGSRSGQRMSFAEWTNFNGICGHQHVPENDHGDPGNFPIKRLIELVKGAKPTTSSKPSTSWDGTSFPGASAFTLGKSHPAVTVLGQRLIAHGYGSYYKVGPGPTFGQADKAATAAFQRAQGWTGSLADGYPGPSTWSRLMAAPKSGTTIVALAAGVKPGARHPQVRDLQQLLIKAGYGPIPGAVTDYYGVATQAAVARFHDRNPKYKGTGLVRDPKIGTQGFIALQRQAGRR